MVAIQKSARTERRALPDERPHGRIYSFATAIVAEFLGICGLHRKTVVSSRMFRSPRHRTILLVTLGSFLALRSVPCATAPEPGDLRGVGKVAFPITSVPDVQSDFARGVALLHSFFYEEARRVFTSVAERDPKCARVKLPLKKQCR